MIYEWDQAKSERNARARGLSFEIAMALFEGPTLEEPDLRKDYGELRIRALGQVDDVVMVCIYTDRSPDVRRIISLRPAKRRERDAYRAAYPR
jgi:uncharacterized DUF497 family protein